MNCLKSLNAICENKDDYIIYTIIILTVKNIANLSIKVSSMNPISFENLFKTRPIPQILPNHISPQLTNGISVKEVYWCSQYVREHFIVKDL